MYEHFSHVLRNCIELKEYQANSFCLKTTVRPKQTLKQSFKLLFPLSLSMLLKKKMLKGEARRVRLKVLKNQLQKVMCARQAGREADVGDEEVDVVGGVDEVRVFGYESEEFTLSEILRRKRLS